MLDEKLDLVPLARVERDLFHCHSKDWKCLVIFLEMCGINVKDWFVDSLSLRCTLSYPDTTDDACNHSVSYGELWSWWWWSWCFCVCRIVSFRIAFFMVKTSVAPPYTAEAGINRIRMRMVMTEVGSVFVFALSQPKLDPYFLHFVRVLAALQ